MHYTHSLKKPIPKSFILNLKKILKLYRLKRHSSHESALGSRALRLSRVRACAMNLGARALALTAAVHLRDPAGLISGVQLSSLGAALFSFSQKILVLYEGIFRKTHGFRDSLVIYLRCCCG